MSQENSTRTTALVQRGIDVRENLLELADSLPRNASALKLPPPSALFTDIRRDLAEQKCTILVVGNVPRVRNAWLNARIGRNIFSQDDSLPQRQAIFLQQATIPRYGLRFEDDSFWEIPESSLSTYASLEGAHPDDAVPDNFRNKILRWVEIRTPCSTLPDFVNFIALPDMDGSSASSSLTQRFLPQANGALLLLGPETPVVPEDMELRRKILSWVTPICQTMPSVLFMQVCPSTEEGWQKVLQRNAAKIQKSCLPTDAPVPHIWPLAAHAAGNALGQKNGVPEMTVPQGPDPAFRLFLLRKFTGTRCNMIATALDHYYEICRQTLEARYAAIQASPPQRRDMLDDLRHMLESLQNDMGPYAAKRRGLMESIRKECASARQYLSQELSAGGELAYDYKKRVDAASATELKALARDLPHEIVDRAQQLCLTVFQTLHAKILRLASEFLDIQEKKTDWVKAFSLHLPQDQVKLTDPGVADHFLKANAYGLGGAGAVSLATQAAVGSGIAGAGLLALSLPVVGITVGTAATLAALVYGLWKGTTYSLNDTLKENRQLLSKKVAEYIDETSKQFFDVSFTQKREKCYVDLQLDTLTADTMRQIAQSYINKVRELQTEIGILEALNDTADIASIRTQAESSLSTWMALGPRVRQAADAATALSQALSELS